MGPFQTIELNAPGGVADYCERYVGFFRRLIADLPTEAVWGEDNVARVLEAWGRAPSKADVLERSAWRDSRLAALKAHKQSQPDI
jgi:hypothetical protein